MYECAYDCEGVCEYVCMRACVFINMSDCGGCVVYMGARVCMCVYIYCVCE